MDSNIIKEMLLISDPSVYKLYKELISIASYFIAPVFTIALLIEYLGEMNFGEVLKKLLIIVIFMGAFYQFHTKAVKISLETASKTLSRVSPSNLFVKKWYRAKVKTRKKSTWSAFQSFVIPNLNDLVGTLFFVLSKIFIWLLKLIYSSVYHLTYIFASFTALLYFLGWTKDALKGTIQASLWCMILPFVVVAILALVGNSMVGSAGAGELAFSSIDNLVWLFGVTLLLLLAPLISYGMIKGDGIHSAGAKMGTMMISSGTHALTALPILRQAGQKARSTYRSGKRGIGRVTSGFREAREFQSKSLTNTNGRETTNRFKENTKSSKTDQKLNQGKDAVKSFNKSTSNTIKSKEFSKSDGHKIQETTLRPKNSAKPVIAKENHHKTTQGPTSRKETQRLESRIETKPKVLTEKRRGRNELRRLSGKVHEGK